MKISYYTLKSFVTPPPGVSARELAESLTMSTVEVEGFVDLGERLKGAVVGLVTAVKPHPGADKLKLATVDIGKKSLEVVCGGVNLRQGMKVAFAQVGTQVRWHGQEDWAPLEKATIRGVESEGMACAAEELDILDEHAVELGPSNGPSIMDLSHLSAELGTPLSEALEMNEVIFEVDNKSITHRPDLWGHLGLARELAAIWQVPLLSPNPAVRQSQPGINLKVTIDEPKHCRRYLAVVLAGIKVAESPAWLKTKLQALGMRPINNIVDATNYVMLELGQPLHAFDLNKLASPEIIVRSAKRGEKIMTLDGEERQLESDMQVIADKKQAQAIAGVMGGEASEVSASTDMIVLESATFDPINIRQTASFLGLRTEASVRFEKGLDPNLAELALRRVVELILELNKTAKAVSQIADAYPRPLEPVTIELNVPWLHRRLGEEVPRHEVVSILERLGFKVATQGDELKVTVPSWRATRDVTIPEDLIEEVARLYGYDKIPLSLPKFAIAPPPADPEQELRWQIRDLLVSAGWTESLSYSFVGKVDGAELELANPVDKTKQFLRPNLLSTLSEQFKAAKRAGYRSVKMFELGRVFLSKAGEYSDSKQSKAKLPNQPWHLILAAYKPTGNSFRVVKGAIELLCAKTGTALSPKYEELSGGYVAEVSLSGVCLAPQYAFQPLPKYPEVVRDISMILPTGVKWQEVEQALGKVSPLLKSLQVFDVYPEKGSIAFSLTFRSPERTLKSEEVDEVMAKIIEILKTKFNATIR